MRLILIGCEYSGTTTLAEGIRTWSNKVMGEGKGLIVYHDHWKIPHTSGHTGFDDYNLFTPEEQEQVLALSPKTKEMIQRHSITYHIAPGALQNPDYLSIGLHIENAIYAPMYFDYYNDEVELRANLEHFEHDIVGLAPDMSLVLIKASPQTILKRMKDDSHYNPVLQERDIKDVLNKFEEEYERSSIKNKFTIDTTGSGVEETLGKFIKEMEQYFNQSDILRILNHRSNQSS